MQINLASPGRRIALLTVCLLAAAVYVGFATLEFVATFYADRADLASLQRSIRLQPGNADYRYRLGRFFTILSPSADQAASAYRAAVGLNPHQARYWLELASAYELLDDSAAQQASIQEAIVTGPKIPDVAWQAANFYVLRGENEKALQELKFVLEATPNAAPAALQLAMRVSPDFDSVLRDVVPPNPRVYYSLLELLESRNNLEASKKTWAQLAGLQQPLERNKVFEYVRFLLTNRDVEQAQTVWRQAADLAGLSAYQPSRNNLIVNSDFDQQVLNGGFDWIYSKSPDVHLAIDPTQNFSGHRSLLVSFNARSLEDAGIRQLVPVEPNTAYEFSAHYKTKNLEGAGGPQFALQDLYSGATYFSSDDLVDAENWKQVSGTFTTGADTRLLVLRVLRVPPKNAIKGNLWIDGVSLKPASGEGHS